jgi:muscarinic acetylcholine receptor
MNSGDKEKIKEETIVIKAPPAANFFQRITTPLRQSFSRRASQNSIKHNHNNNNNSQHSNGKPPTEQPVNNNNTTTTTVNSTFVRASSLERPLSSLLGQAADIPKVKIENEKEESTSAATVTNNNKLTAANNQLKLTPSSTLTAMTASSTNSPKQPVEESCVSVISRAKATTGTNTTVTSGGGSSGTTHRQATLAAANNNTGGAAKRKKMHDNRARKALRTITFILAAFIFCFAPWHVVSVYNSFCVTCFDYPLYHHFFYSCYFLCYLNSPINPFMYALANQQFKKTFTRILKGDFRKM